MKKLLAILLTLALLAGTTSALAGADPVLTAKDRETVTLTVAVQGQATVDSWDENATTLLLEETLNVDLQFIVLPTANAEFRQKVEMMLMGNDKLPDMFWGSHDFASVTKYGVNGLLIPTNDFYANNTYDMDQTFENTVMKKDEALQYVTSYDGNVYGVFSLLESLNNQYSGCRLIVYKPWLDALELVMPSTTEEFYEMLVAFRDKDPNGNGLKDEIPMVGSTKYVTGNMLQALMNPFQYTQTGFYYNDNGTVAFSANTDAWREGLRWINKLYNEGLIDPLSFTQDEPAFNAMMNNEGATIVGVQLRGNNGHIDARDIRRTEYEIMEPLEGPAGEKNQVVAPSLPSISAIITKDCANPQVAFEVCDLMCRQDISLATRWGWEGPDWVQPSETDLAMYKESGYDAMFTITSSVWTDVGHTIYKQRGPHIIDVRWPVGQGVPATNEIYDGSAGLGKSIWRQVEHTNRENLIPTLLFNAEEQKVVNECASTIEGYVGEFFALFATGEIDINDDAAWEAYKAEFEFMGLNEYLTALQSAYDRMYK